MFVFMVFIAIFALILVQIMEIKDLIAIGTLIVVGISLFFSIREYIKRGKKERADFFLNLRDRFKDNTKFMAIIKLIQDDNDSELINVPMQDMNDLLGFFEEIYLFAQSGFISQDILFNFFGEYALECSQNKTISSRLELEKPYWIKFNLFCKDYKSWHSSNTKEEFHL